MVGVGFSTSNYFLSRIIRKVTKPKFSHTWLVYDDETLATKMVLEATFSGYRCIPYSHYQGKAGVEVIEVPHDLLPGLKKVVSYLGSPYDVSGLFGGLLVVIGRWFKRKVRNPWNNPHKLLCSEAVAIALKASNYPNSEYLVPEDVSPEDVYQFLKAF